MAEISSNISVDDFREDTITAYTEEKGLIWFLKQGVSFRLVEPPSLKTGIYPTYPQYLEAMNSFATGYPDICKLINFGSTVAGKQLLAIKISDFPDLKEKEPVVFYSATMHGDEPLGYMIMLKFIDHLLSNYNTSTFIKELIDKTEIWINPLANPDGTYFVSDTSFFGARRFNINNVDLNRDFPQIPSDFTDSMERQPETRYMINFMRTIKPTLAANFHGGAEVVNYPWDAFESYHPDNFWYRNISRAYADTVHNYAPPGYMTFLDNGITRGVDWYQVSGSRQDYTNYYLYGREVTIELADDKIPPASEVENYWNYNKKSLLHFIRVAQSGFSGTITDSATGYPLVARVRIINLDRDNSFVFSGEDGNFFRMVNDGTYQVLVSARGYKNKIVTISVEEGKTDPLNIMLSATKLDLNIYPNPFRDFIMIDFPYSGYMLYMTILDLSGRKVRIIEYPVFHSGENKIPIRFLPPGYYIIHISYNSQTWQFKAIRSQD